MGTFFVGNPLSLAIILYCSTSDTALRYIMTLLSLTEGVFNILSINALFLYIISQKKNSNMDVRRIHLYATCFFWLDGNEWSLMVEDK